MARPAPRDRAADVLAWLRRARLQELPVDETLSAVRSVCGVVPLGGRVGGPDGSTPPTTPRNVLTLLDASPAAQSDGNMTPEQQQTRRWNLLLASCQLPFSGGPEQLRQALKTFNSERHNSDDPLPVESLRAAFYSARRDFFSVRIELIIAARDPQHPSAQEAQEVVDELLKEGLREALLDEVNGRQFTQPPSFSGVGRTERSALVAWELQLLQEEVLLRELLLLVLVASKERATLESAVTLAKTVHRWETKVLDEVFTTRTLATPEAQAAARKLTQLGVLAALRMLDTAAGVQQHAALQQATQTFFLGELCGVSDGMEDSTTEPVASPVPGVLLLAWATLLGRQYREVAGYNDEGDEVEELKIMLQQTLEAAERLHSFHYLNALLRSLVFCSDDIDSENFSRHAILQPLGLSAKNLWALPNVAAPVGFRRGVDAAHSNYRSRSSSGPIYQLVVAAFLNDMLSSLGYMENLEGGQQLYAMVKFVLPALSTVEVAQQILGIDEDMTDGGGSGENVALRNLLQKTRVHLPQSLLPCVEMLTALCCNYENVSSPAVLHQVLRYFSKPRAGLEGHMITSGSTNRQLPPVEYFREVQDEPDRVECIRSFAYDEGEARLIVPACTVGVISRSADEVQVEWLVSNNDGGKNAFSLWDLLMVHADSLVAGLQSGSLADLHRRNNAEDVSVLTSFFEFIVQLGQQRDGGQSTLEDVQRRWGETRLRRWWMDSRLPSPEVHVPQLVSQKVALPMLLTASRENLVSWGIRDRYTREQILAQLGSDAWGLAVVGNDWSFAAAGSNPFSVDGGMHLLRLLLRVLDGFMRASPDGMSSDCDSPWSAAHLHLVTASFSALRALLATMNGIELLMGISLGSGHEECLNLIVKSAKKLFELQERLIGQYPIVLSTQEIFLSVVRWFLAKEAQTLANPVVSGKDKSAVGSDAFVAMERLWFVGAAEFVIAVLSTHESWKFVSTSDRCEVTERCFRLLHVLVFPRKYIYEKNEMVPAFETALRETLSTDMSLLMKLLRSSCSVLSSMEGHAGHWNSIAVNDKKDKDGSSCDNENNDGHFPFVYESETDSAWASVVQLESLVTTSLRLLSLLLGSQNDFIGSRTARKILLTSIDDGGPKKRKSLTVVTLCGGYLGYPLENAPGITYWSLQILQRAAVVLDYRQEREPQELSSMHSLVALFHGYQDLPLVRGMFARLLRVSSPQSMTLRKEVIQMLTLCLEHQPGFLALLLFGNESKNDEKSEIAADGKIDGDPLPFVALLDRFIIASEQLLEQASDLFCALLTFLVQVWKGAIHNGLGVHLKIMAALRGRSTFWPNVTRALKIHMPLESVEERGLLDMELAAATVQGRGDLGSPSSSSEAYFGRSSAYGYLARGLILELVSYEWHNQASRQADHPLVDVLESFRKEGLYSHWLRTFTRLDYSPAQLEQYAASIRRACSLRVPTASLLNELSVGGISMYLEGLICDASALKWQLSAGGGIKIHASPADVRALKLVKWSNLQAAYLHAQLFSLTKWKVFMELFCLQAGGSADSSTPSSIASSGEQSIESTTPRRLKRKESMISSPPRSSGTNSASNSSRLRLIAPLSVSSSDGALASSRFSGDRTSFGMIQVLADVIKAHVNLHENQDETLDYFVLVHLYDLVQLLVSMLHHQLCLVVHKTRDPKLSQTRQRLEGSDPNLKLGEEATLVLLAIIEKTERAVRESMGKITRDMELARMNSNKGDNRMSSPEMTSTTVPLIARLVTDFERKLETVSEGLHTSLFTAALLLVRHLRKVSSNNGIAGMADGDTEMESATPPKSLMQVKLIAHCMNAISLCDAQLQPTQATQALFQLSWCLFQEVLDSFGSTEAKSKLCMAYVVQLNPFVKELEHDQQGIGALFHLLVKRFRPLSYSKEVAAKQEEACQVLRGLVAVVWNPDNAGLCQRVMLSGGSNSSSSLKLRMLSMLATQLLPLLQAQMEREESISKLRGYVALAGDDMETDDPNGKGMERSLAHRMWCLLLDFVGGLVRLSDGSEGDEVWEFVAHAETPLFAAVDSTTCQRLTRALTAEHQSLLRFVNALSGTASRRKSWRQAFPSNAVVLMEQSRQLLRRACVLLGSSSTEINRLRKEKTQKTKQGKSSRTSLSLVPKSPRSPRSPSAFTYAHQTLLHDHLQAVRDVEKRRLTDFHREMETELVEVVRLASLLLTKWTGSLTDRDAVLVVDGVRYVDEEQLVPLLDFMPPSEARSMSSNPCLGHLCLAMEFMLDQLLEDEGDLDDKANAVLANAIDACALLFLKTYLLLVEQYELVKRDRNELNSFFRQLNGRLNGDDHGVSASVDAQLIQHISKIIGG